jgi:hypothetical protein
VTTNAQRYLQNMPSYMRYFNTRADVEYTTVSEMNFDDVDFDYVQSLDRALVARPGDSTTEQKHNSVRTVIASNPKVRSSVPAGTIAENFWNHGDEEGTQVPKQEFFAEDGLEDAQSTEVNRDLLPNSDQSISEQLTIIERADQEQENTVPYVSSNKGLDRQKAKEKMFLERFGLDFIDVPAPDHSCDLKDGEEEKSHSDVEERNAQADELSDLCVKTLLHTSHGGTPDLQCQSTARSNIALGRQEDDLSYAPRNVHCSKVGPRDSKIIACGEHSSTEFFLDTQEDFSDHNKSDAEFYDRNVGIPAQLSVQMEKKERKRKRKEKKETRKKEKKRRKQGKKAKDDDYLETPRKMSFREISPCKATKAECIDDTATKNNVVRELRVPLREYLDTDDHTEDNHQQQGARIHFDMATSTSGTGDSNKMMMMKVGDTQNTAEPSSQSVQSSHIALRMLCSEKFLENFGYVVADLARGDLFEGEVQRIHLLDTPLMEVTEVDIELPNNGGLIVLKTSHMRHFENDMLATVTNLAACSRYKWLDVVLCIDSILDGYTSRCITRLQKAVFMDGDFPGTPTRFTITSQDSLSITIAHSVILLDCVHSSITEDMERCLADAKTKMRLRFLLHLLPSLSVTCVLYWLKSAAVEGKPHKPPEEKYAHWFNQLFASAADEGRWLSSMMASDEKFKGILFPNVALQLQFISRTKFVKETDLY